MQPFAHCRNLEAYLQSYTLKHLKMCQKANISSPCCGLKWKQAHAHTSLLCVYCSSPSNLILPKPRVVPPRCHLPLCLSPAVTKQRSSWLTLMEVKAKDVHLRDLNVVITECINLITTRFGCATVTSHCCASSVRADWYWQISTCELELRECNPKGTGFLPAAGLGAPIRQTAGKLHAPQGDLKATFPCEDNTSWEHTCWFVYCMHITRVICQYKCTVRQRSRVLFSLVPSL